MASFEGSQTNSSLSTIWLEASSGSGVENIVELRNYCGEEDESCPCTKNSFSQCLAIWRVFTENGPIMGVVGIPHGTRQQAHLSNEEKYPVMKHIKKMYK